MISGLFSALSVILLLVGAAFVVIGNVGLVRLPDFYTRLHAAGLTDTLGATLVLGGLAVEAGLTLVTVKLLLIMVFVFFTSPTATHALAKTALHHELRPQLPDAQEDPASTS